LQLYNFSYTPGCLKTIQLEDLQNLTLNYILIQDLDLVNII